jgi:hypothetical protein
MHLQAAEVELTARDVHELELAATEDGSLQSKLLALCAGGHRPLHFSSLHTGGSGSAGQGGGAGAQDGRPGKRAR